MAARDIPRGTVLFTYGGSLARDDMLEDYMQPYSLGPACRVVSPTESQPVEADYVLVAQGNEVGTTAQFLDHKETTGNVGMYGLTKNSIDARCVILGGPSGPIRVDDPMEMDYGSRPGQGDKFLQHCKELERRRSKKCKR